MGSTLNFSQALADRRDNLRHLQAAFARLVDPLPAVATSPPTVAHATSPTLSRVHPANLLMERAEGGILRGNVGNWNASINRVDVNARPVVVDLWVTDTVLELGWLEAVGNGTRQWIWVDGVPIASAPTGPPLATSSYTSYWTKLTWSTRARRRVTVWFANTNSIVELRTSSNGWVASTGRQPKVAIVGDSYIGGSDGSSPPNGIAEVASRTLGFELLNEGIGGSGYGAGTTFSDSGRVARVQAFKPDLIVFFGSINDSASGLTTAATNTYTAYANACPGVPQLVIGAQPTNATTTISAAQVAAAKAIRDAAIAHKSVVAYFDPIGYAATGALPSVINGAYTDIVAGTLYSYQGSVWKGLTSGNTGPGTPGGSSLLELVTWGYSGTGNAGTTDGTGSRDVFMYGGDNVHPTTEGAYFLGLAVADAISAGIRTALGLTA